MREADVTFQCRDRLFVSLFFGILVSGFCWFPGALILDATNLVVLYDAAAEKYWVSGRCRVQERHVNDAHCETDVFVAYLSVELADEQQTILGNFSAFKKPSFEKNCGGKNKCTAGSHCFNDKGNAKRFVEKYNVGQTYGCDYDPDHPDNIAMKNNGSSLMTLYIIGVVFLCVSAFCCCAVVILIAKPTIVPDLEDLDLEAVSAVLAPASTPGLGAGYQTRLESSKLSEGDKVEADFKGRGTFYKGKIGRDRGDGTFDVYYNDGDKELHVRKSSIRPLGSKLSEGDKVEADFKGRGTFYKGKIGRDRGDGTFDVYYDDGDKELHVRKSRIRPLGRGRGGGETSGGLSEGDKVEADFKGRGRHYKGKISRDRGDCTFDVDYDDGDKETRVHESLIRISSRWV